MRAFVLLVVLLPLFSLVSAGPANAAPPPRPATNDVLVTLAKLHAAGDDAGVVWMTLTDIERTLVLGYLRPTFYTEGRTAELVSVRSYLTSTPEQPIPPDNYTDPYPPPLPINSSSAISSPAMEANSRLADMTIQHHKRFVQGSRYECDYMDFIDSVRANGPGELSLSISQTISNHWEASVEISAEFVSAGMRWDVEYSWTVQHTRTKDMPDNHTYEIDAYSRWEWYTFQVWAYDHCVRFDGGPCPSTQIGDGDAHKYQGIYFYTWKVD
jgi:hypothetical protein